MNPDGEQPRAWRCMVCGYVHRESEPPEYCPVCGAPRDEFEPYLDDSHIDIEAGTAATQRDRGGIVVLGAGIAGVTAAEAAARNAPFGTEVTLVSREPDIPYYRLNLTRFLAGEVTENQLPLHPETWYEEKGIRILRGVEASHVSPSDKTVALTGGRTLSYEKLILTAGAHPFVPPIPGSSREGVTCLRTVRDAANILEMIRKAGDVVCIGGGILGLETAAALARRGARVTLLESHEWILPRQLNRRAGELLADYAMRSGISILTHARTKEILGDERAAGVQLEDGKVIHAGSIIISAGVRPNSYLARRASLHVNQGIVVDDHLRSSHPDVFAAGDIAEHRGVLYGIWSPAQYQGFIAGSNSAGRLMEFGGIPMSHTLKVLGIGMTSIGTVEFLDGSYLVAEEENGGAYCRFVFRDGALVGALFLGDTGVSGFAKKAIEDHTDFSDLLSKSPACRDIIEILAQKTASL